MSDGPIIEQPKTNVSYVEVYRADDGEWHWRAIAGNGEIVAHGEGHTRSEDAARAADGVLPGINIRLEEDSPV